MGGCSVVGCQRPHFGKGLCNTHYCRLRRTGSVDLAPRAVRSAPSARPLPQECDLDGCARPASRRVEEKRVCSMHAHRYERHGDFDTVGKLWGAPNPNKRICDAEDCARLEDGNSGLCKMHETRRRRHGDPLVFVHQSDRDLPRGDRHPNWTGRDATYRCAHQRVKRDRGPAKRSRCVDCGQAAAEWSYDGSDPAARHEEGKGHYSLDLERYVPRCVLCHRRFDAAARRAS